MTADKIKARILVIVQLGCIIFIFVSGSPVAYRPLLFLLQIAGLAIGIWAVAAMGIGNTNISPLVKQGAMLVTRGPYRLIRHPMYLAVLLVILPLVIDYFSLSRVATGFLLITDLIIKMRFEECLLKKQFAEYEAYMSTTKRLIPLIF
ncbi:MAG: isoprenylcysteine carboxylmethyltransferase family protein [Syntrophales bacterium]|jgi:protein-S-isoprenylcysteine O-methyltransferase Ste14